MNPIPQEAASAPAHSRYRLAGYGFLILNLLYALLFWHFLPPFNLGATAYASAAAYVLLLGLFTYLICKGSRRTAITLALIFGARSAISVYTLATGEAFVAVPYVLPCLLATFYLLGRAAWNWP